MGSHMDRSTGKEQNLLKQLSSSPQKLALSVPPGSQTSTMRSNIYVSGLSKTPVQTSLNSCPSHCGPEDISPHEKSQHTSC